MTDKTSRKRSVNNSSPSLPGNNINEALEKVATTLTNLSSKIDSINDSLTTKIDHLNTALTNKINEIDDKVTKVQQSVGAIYEMGARRELKRIRGDDYGRSFLIKYVHGLARILLPKEPCLAGELRDQETNTAIMLNNRADMLVNHIVNNV